MSVVLRLSFLVVPFIAKYARQPPGLDLDGVVLSLLDIVPSSATAKYVIERVRVNGRRRQRKDAMAQSADGVGCKVQRFVSEGLLFKSLDT
jgi:hypothetical protein